MGYFANGTEGDIYEARYCARCIHRGDPDGPGCPVMLDQCSMFAETVVQGELFAATEGGGS